MLQCSTLHRMPTRQGRVHAAPDRPYRAADVLVWWDFDAPEVDPDVDGTVRGPGRLGLGKTHGPRRSLSTRWPGHSSTRGGRSFIVEWIEHLVGTSGPLPPLFSCPVFYRITHGLQTPIVWTQTRRARRSSASSVSGCSSTPAPRRPAEAAATTAKTAIPR